MLGWHESGRLKPGELDELTALAGRLRQSWRDGQPADLGHLLADVGPRLRLPFLLQLVRTDLEMSFRHNAPRSLDTYLQQFPEIGPASSLPVDLIVAEYSLRHAHGDAPTLTSYETRFPTQFPLMQERLTQQGFGTLHVPDNQATIAAPPPSPPPQLSKPSRASVPVPPPSTRTVGTAVPTRTGASDEIPPIPSAIRSGSGARRRPQDEVGMGYTLVERLGSGAFGEVFRALAPGDIPAAVKRLYRPVEDVVSQREQQSLEVMKSLRHSFLLQTQAYWVKDERLHIAMELAHGSLQDWFKECRAKGMPGIPFEQMITYFREAAEALDFLHQQGRIHRDIKPANLLHLHGHAKVADFGLARLFENDEATGTFCGTPQYMAPEMWKSHASPRSDQYCLAVAFVELTRGKPPYSGKSQFALEAMHTQGKPDLEGFTLAEQRVLQRALAKNPERRFPTCVEFIEALAVAHAPPAVKKRPRSMTRRVFLASVKGVLGGVSAAVLVAAGILVSQKLRQPKLPEGFAPAEGAQIIDGKWYDRIVFTGLTGIEPIEFLLIRQTGPNDPPTFYVMRDKVTCEQFRAALEQLGLKEKLEEQKKRFDWAVQRKWQKALDESENAHRPVMGVTVVEADCFAALLGGRLPSEQQWDKAGGRWDESPWGPTLEEKEQRPEERKGLDRPAPVGDDPFDVSGHGCRGMAGNGREWTRSIKLRNDVEVPLANPGPKDEINLRGESFWGEKYFQFRWLADDAFGYPEPLQYQEAKNDVGFRVVFEPRN